MYSWINSQNCCDHFLHTLSWDELHKEVHASEQNNEDTYKSLFSSFTCSYKLSIVGLTIAHVLKPAIMCSFSYIYVMRNLCNCPFHIMSNSLAQYVKSTCFTSNNFQSISSRFLKFLYVVRAHSSYEYIFL